MAGERSKKIFSRVRYQLQWNDSLTLDERAFIYDACNQVQLRICDEAGAKQVMDNITLTSGTELYSLPSGMNVVLTLLQGTTTPLKKINIEEVAEIKRRGTDSSTTADPMYYYFFNGQIGVMTSTGDAVSAGGTITVYGWKLPKSDGTEDISDTVNPIVERRWDVCIGLGAIAYIRGAEKDHLLFESEMKRQKSFDSQEKDNGYIIQSTGDYE